LNSSSWRALGVTIGVVLLVGGPRLAGQVPAGGPDVLTQLLAEVRGLRAAMEQMAASGPRVQLALGRLQLQEQMVNTLLRRLDEIRKELNDAQTEQEMHQQQLKMFGAAIDKADNPEREEAAGMAEQFKAMVATASRRVQRLQEEENSTSQMLASEQARWGDINRNVEELERSLNRVR
jgi:chromosome segregation ATPase